MFNLFFGIVKEKGLRGKGIDDTHIRIHYRRQPPERTRPKSKLPPLKTNRRIASLTPPMTGFAKPSSLSLEIFAGKGKGETNNNGTPISLNFFYIFYSSP